MSKNTNANLDCPSIIFFLGYQPVHSTIISLQVPQRPCPAPRRTTTRRARTRTSSGRTRWTRRRSRRTRPDSASPRQLPPGQAQQRHPASHQVRVFDCKNMELEWNKKTFRHLFPAQAPPTRERRPLQVESAGLQSRTQCRTRRAAALWGCPLTIGAVRSTRAG